MIYIRIGKGDQLSSEPRGRRQHSMWAAFRGVAKIVRTSWEIASLPGREELECGFCEAKELRNYRRKNHEEKGPKAGRMSANH